MQRKNDHSEEVKLKVPKVKITVDRDLGPKIKAIISDKFKGAAPKNPALSIPLCIGYSDPVPKETFAANVEYCNQSGIPYQIILYRNPANDKAVQAWLLDNSESLRAAGASLIDDAKKLETAPKWIDAKKRYDAFFHNGSGVNSEKGVNGNTATPQNTITHEEKLLKDAGAFLRRTSREFDQGIITRFLAEREKPLEERLKTLPADQREILAGAIKHVVKETIDCMAGMSVESTTKDSTVTFLLCQDTLLQTINHVFTLAEKLGYVEGSLTYVTYNVQTPNVVNAPRKKPTPNNANHTPEGSSPLTISKRFAMFVEDTAPPLAKVFVENGFDAKCLTDALVNSFLALDKAQKESELSMSPPRTYSNDRSPTLFARPRSSQEGSPVSGTPTKNALLDDREVAQDTKSAPTILSPRRSNLN